ncbi:MAG TPA: hypothetical protein VEC35_01380 [Noviherbaspirillum sp.]|nr:hypothetical protein [Noviherbaspirillum sp.]
MDVIEPISVTDSVLFASNVFENDYPAWANNVAYALGDRRILTSTHKIYESVKATSSLAVTISIASPGVVTWAAHGLSSGTPVSFATSGALPTGLAAATTYYVVNPTTDTFQVAATAGGAAINTSGSQSGTHTATAQSNYNRSPDTNTTFWTEVSATNKWKMFDAQNNTQTTNTDSIEVDLVPASIATGVFLGGLDGDSVTVTVTDPTDGIVYSETKSLLISNSGSSFWGWGFNRILKRTALAFTNLPPYVAATVSISIDKPGGTAKCGMCCLGPVVNVGITERNVSTDIKDYSSTTFNADGTSTTVVRDYAKRMTVDCIVDNDIKDAIENQLASYRQTPVVWIGSTKFETTMIYGTFSSFKVVIESFPRSRASLQIEGRV